MFWTLKKFHMLHNGSLYVLHINLQFGIGPSNAVSICSDGVDDIAVQVSFLERSQKCQSWLEVLRSVTAVHVASGTHWYTHHSFFLFSMSFIVTIQ